MWCLVLMLHFPQCNIYSVFFLIYQPELKQVWHDVSGHEGLSNYAAHRDLPHLNVVKINLIISLDDEEESVLGKKKQTDSKKTCLNTRQFQIRRSEKLQASHNCVHSNCIDSNSSVRCPVFPPTGEITDSHQRRYFLFAKSISLWVNSIRSKNM